MDVSQILSVISISLASFCLGLNAGHLLALRQKQTDDTHDESQKSDS